VASFWDKVNTAISSAAQAGLNAATGGGLNILTAALDWAKTTSAYRDSNGFGKMAVDYLSNQSDAVRNLVTPNAPTRYEGGKLVAKDAESSAWEPVDDLVENQFEAIKGGWEFVTGLPVIGDQIAGVGAGIGNAVTWYDDNVIEPVFNYAKATDRHYANLMQKHQETGDFGYAAEALGTMFGLGEFVGGEEFDLEQENAARYSIGQQVVAEATGKFQWDAETGRYVAPILDDPNLEQERQDYFSRGWQRFFSGTIDLAANIGLDPATYVTAGAGAVAKKATEVGVEVVEGAARSSRGAEAAMLADDARWLETTDVDTLSSMKVKDLKDLARENGLKVSGTKQELVERLATRERAIPEHAQFDPKLGSYVPEGSFTPSQPVQGLRQRIGLDPERNFKANYEKITDYVLREGDKAGSIAALKTNPLLRQLDDSGPVLDALDTAKKYGEAQGLDDLQMHGLLDDVLLMSMGSRQATARVKDFSKRLYADMIDIEKALGEGRKSIMASPYIPFKDKLDAFETDPAVRTQIEAIADDMRAAALKLDRLQNQTVGKTIRARGAFGRTLFKAPGAIARGIDNGLTRAVRTFRPTGPGGPRVHFMTGIRLPNTLDFASLNVVEEFTQHVDDTIAVIRKDRLEGASGAMDVSDDMIDLMARYKDEFAKTEDPIGRRDADALAARRRAIFEEFQETVRENMLHKLTSRVIAKERGAGRKVNPENIRAEVDTWMREYEKQSHATVEGFHRKRNDKDPAHVSNEYIALSDNDFVSMHGTLAEALDKATPTTSHRFRWDAFEDFFEKKFELGKVFNETDPAGVNLRTVLGEVSDEVNDHLKWLLLGRPVAYAVRNAFESSLRILATQDVLTAFASVGRGLLNGVGNLKRVPVDQVRLVEAQLNHSILERRLLEERQDLEDVLLIHEETAKSLKRKHKPSGAEFNRAAEVRARIEILDEQIARSQEVTNMSLDEWREQVKQRASVGLEKQIEEFEGDLAVRYKTLERIDNLKDPTTSDLHLRDTIQEEINLREGALREARESLEQRKAAFAAEGEKKVRRGNTVLRKTLGFEGGLDTRTGMFVPPSLLNAYDNPLHMRQHITDSFDSINRVVETSTARWAKRDFRIRNKELAYGSDPAVAREWNEAYAALVNNRIRRNPGAMRYALTQREDALLDWAENTAEGVQWVQEFTKRTGLTPEDLIDETVGLVDEMLPTGKHLTMAARRDLTPEDVDEMWTEVKGTDPAETAARLDEAQGVAQKSIDDLGTRIDDTTRRIEEIEAAIERVRRPVPTPRGEALEAGQGELEIGVPEPKTKPKTPEERRRIKRLKQKRERLISERRDLEAERLERAAEDSTTELRREVEISDATRRPRPRLSVPERAFRDILPEGQERLRGVQHAAASLNAVRDRYFHAFSAVPEGVWSRHPLFVMKFQRELDQILNAKGVKPSGRKVTDKDAQEYLTLDEINKSVEVARRRAKRYVTDTLYDTSRRTNLQHHLRYLSPFFAAWQDSFVKWTKISMDQPLVPYLGWQGYQNFPNLFEGSTVVDDDGNYIGEDGQVYEYNVLTGEVGAPIEGKTANPNMGTILWRVPGPVGDWLKESAGVDHLRLPKTSFNVAFQGENPLIPGLGGFVAVPYGEVVRRWPMAADLAQTIGLDKIIAPYGPGGRAGEEAIPSWVTKARDFFKDNDEAGMQAFRQLYLAQLNAEALGQTDPLSTEERDRLVNNRVGMWQFFNMVGAQSPFSVSMDSRMQAAANLFFDSYASRIGEDGGYDSYTQAVAQFNQDFPEYANAGISIRADDTGINASYGAQTAAEQWRYEIGKDPALARVLIGPTAADSGDYNEAIAEYQKSNEIIPGGATWRAGLTQEDISNVILVENGKREWSRFNMLLSAMAEEHGIEWEDERLAQVRKVFRDQYMAQNHGEWYAEYTSESYNKNEIVKTLAGTYQAIQAHPDLVEQTPHLATMQRYIEGRIAMKGLMEQSGFATTESQEFQISELGYQWETFVNGLMQEDVEFQQIYYELGMDRDNLQYVLPEVG
jgi:hypothetical protein